MMLAAVLSARHALAYSARRFGPVFGEPSIFRVHPRRASESR
jgi:hypothetical protein